MNTIILENGYNTDYIYSLIIALFFSPCDSVNKIINNDTNNSDTYYIQEYIKTKLIYPIHHNMSIESHVINKFRLYLNNCGWLKNNDIMKKTNIMDFYKFLIVRMMDYNIHISKNNPITNKSTELRLDCIEITEKDINNTSNDIINLSSVIKSWSEKNLENDNSIYRFETIPSIIPVYLNIKNNDNLNIHYVNIMEGIQFDNCGDKIQQLLVWEIHSMICETSDGEYYSIAIDGSNNWIIFSDNHIPSNWKLSLSDVDIVRQIMKEIRIIIYKLS
jgi:hypothetical protein